MLVLHFAPDNASLIVRILLEELGIEYETRLVDRAAREHRSAGYKALNPNGLIPVLEMDGEPLFETGAILLTLADRYNRFIPAIGDPKRAVILKWLFFLSNALHTDLRMIFYTGQYCGREGRDKFFERSLSRLKDRFAILDSAYARTGGPYLLGADMTISDIYAALCLRWPQLYPLDAPGTIAPGDFPALVGMAEVFQDRDAVKRSFQTEGIAAPFIINPAHPDGSAGAAT